MGQKPSVCFDGIVFSDISYCLGTNKVDSDVIETQLSDFYAEHHIAKGTFATLTGIKSRYYWPDEHVEQHASEAAHQLLKRTGLTVGEVNGLIHCGVQRRFLEPATACEIAARLGLTNRALLFDVTNACLGVCDGMLMAASMIHADLAETILLTTAESPYPTVAKTIEKINREKEDYEQWKQYYALFTLGASGVALAMTKNTSLFSKHHKIMDVVYCNDADAYRLCRATATQPVEMRTDSQPLIERGYHLVVNAFEALREKTNQFYGSSYKVLMHQVSRGAVERFYEAIKEVPYPEFVTYPDYGNLASASLPFTLAKAAERGAIQSGETVVLIGVGSGLNAMAMAITW